MYLEQDEPNEDWLRIKPKTSKQISWISHQCISSKLQKGKNLHNNIKAPVEFMKKVIWLVKLFLQQGPRTLK